MTTVSFNPAVTARAATKFGSAPSVGSALLGEAAKDTMTITTRYWPTMGTNIAATALSGLKGLAAFVGAGATATLAAMPFVDNALTSVGAPIGGLAGYLTAIFSHPYSFKTAANSFLKVAK